MPDPITALVVGGSTLLSGAQQSKSAGQAADAQGQAADKGIAEQRTQFEAMRALLQPYTQAGAGALQGQQNLIGLGGADAQSQAIQGLAGGPEMQAMQQQGENAILQSASATGGLRGGNIQGALAQFRPQMLSQLINQQFSRLGGIASLGQNAAAGVGNAGMGMAANVGNLYGQQGAAAAGQYLGEGRAIGGALNMPSQILGMQYGMQQPGTVKLGLGF